MVGLVVPMLAGNPNEVLLQKAARFLASAKARPVKVRAGKPLNITGEQLHIPYVHDMVFRGWRTEVALPMQAEAFVASVLRAGLDEPVVGFDIPKEPTITITSPRYVIGRENPFWDKGGRFAVCVRVDRTYVWVIVDERTKTILTDETLQYFLESNCSPKIGLNLNYWAGNSQTQRPVHHHLNGFIVSKIAMLVMDTLTKNENEIVSEACIRVENTSGIASTVGAEISIGQIKHNGIIIKTLEQIESPEVAPAVLFFIKNKDVPIRNIALLDGQGHKGWYEVSHLGRNRYKIDRPFTCPNITSKFGKLLGNWKVVSK